MTPTQRKAMEQALEALKHGVTQLNGIGIPLESDPLHAAIAALRAALANGDNLSPVGQEPFGYFNNPALDGWQDCSPDDEGAIALYESPQPAQVVNLTDEQASVIADKMVQAIEAHYRTRGGAI